MNTLYQHDVMVFPLLSPYRKKVYIETVCDVSDDSIIEHVANHFGITVEQMVSPSRKKIYVWPRMIAMRKIRTRLPNLSLTHIGSKFGGRDHSTVIYNLETFENLVDTDKEFKRVLASYEEAGI